MHPKTSFDMTQKNKWNIPRWIWEEVWVFLLCKFLSYYLKKLKFHIQFKWSCSGNPWGILINIKIYIFVNNLYICFTVLKQIDFPFFLRYLCLLTTFQNLFLKKYSVLWKYLFKEKKRDFFSFIPAFVMHFFENFNE